MGLGLLCLALTGGRSLVTQEGRTRESGNGFCHLVLPSSELGRIM